MSSLIKRYIGHYRSENIIVGTVSIMLAVLLGVYLTEYPTKEFLLVLLAFIGIGISVFKPNLPLFMLFLFIPLETITLLPSQTLTKLIGLFLGCLVFAQFMVTKKIFLPKGRKKFWILTFGFVAALSLLVSIDISITQKYLITLWLLIVMYFVLTFIIRDIKTLNLAILCLLVGGFLSIVLNSVMGLGWARYAPSAEDVRRGGLWGNANSFASILLVLMPLALLQFFRFRTVLMKVLALGFFAVFLVGFFNTYSRGGFVALAAVLMFSVFKFNILKKRSNKIKIFAYAMLVAIIGVAIFSSVSEKYTARIGTLQSADDRSIKLRTHSLLSSLEIFLDHPLLGVGLKAASREAEGAAHNMYVEVLSGTGIVGFIPFMAILYFSWRELKSVQNFCRLRGKENSLNYQYAVALELGFVAYLVSALFLSIDLDKMNWLLIALSSVLLSVSKNMETVSYRNETKRPDSHRYATIGRG